MTRALVVLLLAGCAPAWKNAPHDTVHQHAAAPILHPKPAEAAIPLDWWNRALHTTVVPLSKLVSPARAVERVTGSLPALDINAFGQVPDSAWFENRIGVRSLTAAEVGRGAWTGGPPAPGPMEIVGGKSEGITPGMILRDAEGTTWFVKFDPPPYPELSTGAEMVAARLLWAVGYHVPETHIRDIDLGNLTLDPQATTRDDYNRTVPLDEARLRKLVTLINPDPEGKARALFSRAVPGDPLGPFRYRGIRPDDPNDRIPHQRRRSLRGLRLVAAWLNNADTRSQNTMDTFIPVEGELGYVRHYLLDFGDALGAAGDREKYVGEGYEYRIDWVAIGARLVSLGLRYPYWLGVRRSPYRSVGVFESEVFDPARWHPLLPNPAFDEADARDDLWAAALIARIRPEHIEAAVASAAYSSPEAAAYVVRVLAERRVKVLRYAFARMLPVAAPRVDGPYTLVLDDLEVVAGLRELAPRYAWSVRWNRTGHGDVPLDHGGGRGAVIDLRDAVRNALTRAGETFANDPFLTVSLWRVDQGGAAVGPRVDVHVRAVRDYIVPVGMWREID